MASVTSQEDDSVPSSEADVDCWERVEEPSHYKLTIESFSSLDKMLSESGFQYYQSNIFKASGYKWRFLLYPNGDATRNGRDHISVFLRIEDTAALPLGWEIYTDLKFFMFDYSCKKYSVFQSYFDPIRKFHRSNPECGIPKLVSRGFFDGAANGYLANNEECVFGVEVFVLDSNKCVGEYLSQSVNFDETINWTIFDYSILSSSHFSFSDEFTANSFKWRLKLYPPGENLGVFLELIDQPIACAELLVEFTLCIRNQRSENHKRIRTIAHFVPTSEMGWEDFMPLADLRDESMGFVVDNRIIIEAQIKNVLPINSSALSGN